MGLFDISWEGLGVIATGTLGVYNIVRQHFDRKWSRNEPIRLAQRDIRQQLRDQYELVLADVETIQRQLHAGENLPPEFSALKSADQMITALAKRLDKPLEKASIEHEASQIALFQTISHGVQMDERLLPGYRQLVASVSPDSQISELAEKTEQSRNAGRMRVLSSAPETEAVLKERIRILTDTLDRGRSR